MKQLQLMTQWSQSHICMAPHQFKIGGKGLRFGESGLMRFAATVGFIDGMRSSGNVEKANILADHFMQVLGYLDEYGGPIKQDGWTRRDTPSVIVQLVDDGGFGSFGIGWFRFIKEVPWGTIPESPRQIVEDGLLYEFFMNGGLIFHGRSNDPHFQRVGADNNPWSIHT